MTANGPAGRGYPERVKLDPAACYRALRTRDARFDGRFFTAVRSTGVYCRPICPAPTPRRENCTFVPSAAAAQEAGYRPCLRCRPLEPRGTPPVWLRELLGAVEEDPSRRWRDADLNRRGLDPARVRRWFQREHGMTFHAYLRARRVGLALGRLRHGEDLTMVALDHGFDSLSGFRQAFKRVFGDAPGRARDRQRVFINRLLTPLGPMIAAGVDPAEDENRGALHDDPAEATRDLRPPAGPGVTPIRSGDEHERDPRQEAEHEHGGHKPKEEPLLGHGQAAARSSVPRGRRPVATYHSSVSRTVRSSGRGRKPSSSRAFLVEMVRLARSARSASPV